MKPESAVRIVQISDCHLRSTPGAQSWGVDVDAGLRAVLTLATGLQPALLLATGDLVHDEGTPAYERLRDDFLLPSGLPVAALPGNHDDSDAPPPAGVQVRCSGAGSSKPAAGNCCCSIRACRRARPERLAPSELDFLQQSLAARPQTLTLVALHHPPLTGCAGFDAIALENRAELFGVLKQAPQVWARGVRTPARRGRYRHRWHPLPGCPSTCIQFDLQAPEPAADAAHGPGCRLLNCSRTGGCRRRCCGSRP